MIRYDRADAVATITMDRPEKRNALNGDMVAGLQDGFDRSVEDPRVRVVVLTGAGTAFSAGADLDALASLQTATALENLADSRRLATLMETIYRCPKPVIARVNGHAIAGGCGLVSVCDFALSAETAKFGFTEVRIGFVPAIVMVFASRKMREVDLRELMLRGHVVTAEEAHRKGLITRVVPESELDSETDALARELVTQTSASALALTKGLLADLFGMGFDEALHHAALTNAFARSTSDCQKGIDAFLNKKPMPWNQP